MKLNLTIEDGMAFFHLDNESVTIKAKVNTVTVAYYTAMILGRIPSKVVIPGSKDNVIEFKEKAANG